jgi:hypothetical protein
MYIIARPFLLRENEDCLKNSFFCEITLLQELIQPEASKVHGMYFTSNQLFKR